MIASTGRFTFTLSQTTAANPLLDELAAYPVEQSPLRVWFRVRKRRGEKKPRRLRTRNQTRRDLYAVELEADADATCTLRLEDRPW